MTSGVGSGVIWTWLCFSLPVVAQPASKNKTDTASKRKATGTPRIRVSARYYAVSPAPVNLFVLTTGLSSYESLPAWQRPRQLLDREHALLV
jgi:hypothetical protein